MSGMTRCWQRWCWKLGVGAVFVAGALTSLRDCAFAQITPDTSLGAENSVVTPLNPQIDQIDGGVIRGANLFHSFREFNVGEGRGAYFTNPAGIENILTRVTGINASNILGTLGITGGNANLFLINPNGIIFGPNARLDVGGSFVATTANAIQIGEQSFFSASAPTAPPPILTVNPSAFLFNQIVAESVVNHARIQVPNGESLLLVGGNVSLNGGALLALGGRIELGGVAGAGTVGLKVDGNDLRLSLPDGVARTDVSLTNGAEVNVRTGGGGSIAINTQNLILTGGSRLLAGIAPGLGSVGSKAGDIEINARGAISFDGESPTFLLSGAYNRVESRAAGQAGNIKITARSLSATNGAIITTSTRGRGNAGSVTINANKVSFDGEGSFNPQLGFRQSSGAFSSVQSGAEGDAGSIKITTGSLSVTNGAALYSSTFAKGDAGSVIINADTVSFDGEGSFNPQSGLIQPSGPFSSVSQRGVGQGGSIKITTRLLSVTNGAELIVNAYGRGKAGSIQINATETVNLSGVSPNGFSSGLFSATEENATDEGGEIRVNAGTLHIADGAVLSARTRSAFGGGNVIVDVTTLEVTGGGQILTTAFSSGRAGNITLNVTDSIVLAGSDSTYLQRLAQFGRPIVDSVDSASGVFANTTERSTGQGGYLTIQARNLLVQDGAKVNVNSQGLGDAGNLEVGVHSILLENRGQLTAETTSGNGGDITLQVRDSLLLRHSSQISTDAGTALTGGNGGNIRINAPLIVAVPSEDSDITANAFTGNGGRVQITAQGIFGIQFREEDTLESDITASSRFGVDGVVEFNTPDIDPNPWLVNLPAQPAEAEVAQGCEVAGSENQSEFLITGRGGLPSSPNEPLSSDAVQSGLATLNSETENRSHSAVSPPPTRPKPLVEAQGWVIGANGKVVLTAHATTTTPPRFWQPSAECHAPQSDPRF